ncbi:HAD-IA family hydrolase [Pseudomonas chlororaphis]|uniref:HAD-IA family hydrolase n=1 Tax=Pseudomonas chlororaphis TaxID=587753 RepID=UPI000BE22FFD|nr:HAD-IA family hydrolase [Pseudomonas chlororaphis]
MHPDYKLLIFDWDGTLADSIGRIVEAMHVASDRSGLARCDDFAVKGIIGLGLPEAIRTLYPHISDAELVNFRQHYADHYIALEAEPSPLFVGVVQSLEAFRREGYHLAVATGKARRGLDRVLKAHGWEDYFDITRAADETASKPHPLMLEQILAHCEVRPEQALMVGDSSFDLLMARNAGMASVAVSYGAQSLEALQAYEPRLSIDSFPQLHAWLSRRGN